LSQRWTNIQVSELYYQLRDKVHKGKVVEGIHRCRLRGRNRIEKSRPLDSWWWLENAPTNWYSKLQKCIATSTAELEYYGVSECTKHSLWYINILNELII